MIGTFGKPPISMKSRRRQKKSVIAASHAQEQTSVMGKLIGQPVNKIFSRQTNSKITAGRAWIIHNSRNFLGRLVRQTNVDMKEPENFAARGLCARIHLCRASGRALNQLIAKFRSEERRVGKECR